MTAKEFVEYAEEQNKSDKIEIIENNKRVKIANEKFNRAV